MRFFTGLLVGVFLTIGTAFVVDSLHAAPGADDRASQRMVNWGVVNDNLGTLSSGVQTAWAKIVGEAKDLDKKTEKSGT